jgi:hypothetical protein
VREEAEDRHAHMLVGSAGDLIDEITVQGRGISPTAGVCSALGAALPSSFLLIYSLNCTLSYRVGLAWNLSGAHVPQGWVGGRRHWAAARWAGDGPVPP